MLEVDKQLLSDVMPTNTDANFQGGIDKFGKDFL